ncbi:DUF4058 domain-containing protein [Tundrisphaera lichenicola]|uniref:DUF4058 domain-containing protein n=1 Tax=Tundrisphaera lichenicola TaxID=2029860 RepID=UPI003EBA22BE
MPLLDHFRPPLSLRRHWHSFHNAWATCLAWDLNSRLPEGYFAEPNVQFGIEIDVATFEESTPAEVGPGIEWTPPHPSMTIPFSIVTDTVEVAVFDSSAGPVLAGAIELISPANKDRPAQRDAFVSKCAAYLQAGVGVMMVDVVTSRGGDLHHDLLGRLLAPEASTANDRPFCSAYRPVDRQGQVSLDIWHEPLAVGSSLPVLALCLKGGPCLPIDLEATYERTCREQRIGDRA